MIKRLSVILPVLMALIICLTGCSSREIYKFGILTTFVGVPSSDTHHAVYSGRPYISSGDTYLYFDENTYSVAVKNAEDDYRWTTLPLENTEEAALFQLTLVRKGIVYNLNSQDNSVALSGSSVNKTGSTLSLIYNLYPDSGKAFCVKLSLDFTLEDGYLTVSTDTSEWEIPEDSLVTEFSLLPFFGAADSNAGGIDLESDYFCVPDGCGALVYTKKTSPRSVPLVYDVYTDNVMMPAFGVKHENSAFACVSVAGDCVDEIVCDTSSKYKTIYSKYVLAEKYGTDDGCFVGAYSGKITQVYAFAGGSRLSFADISSVAANVFEKYGFFPSDNPKVCDTAVIMQCTDKDGKALSGFSDIQSVNGLLKGKGINNIKLYLEGVLDDSSLGFSSAVSDSAGGKAGLKDLCTYAHNTGTQVYLSSFLRTKTGSSDVLENYDGKVLYGKDSDRYYLSGDAIAEKFPTYLTEISKLPADGLCIADASADIFTPSGGKNTTAQELYGTLSSFVTLAGNTCRLSLSGGYSFMMTSADAVLSVPVSASVESDSDCEVQPFVLSILHGNVRYFTTPVNTADIPVISMLKAVEYGAGASFLWNCDFSSPYYYENNLQTYVDFALDTAENLGDLVSAEITDHYFIKDGVYCTEYDNKTLVYVNYNNTSVSLGDVFVMPYDYVRLN